MKLGIGYNVFEGFASKVWISESVDAIQEEVEEASPWIKYVIVVFPSYFTSNLTRGSTDSRKLTF